MLRLGNPVLRPTAVLLMGAGLATLLLSNLAAQAQAPAGAPALPGQPGAAPQGAVPPQGAAPGGAALPGAAPGGMPVPGPDAAAGGGAAPGPDAAPAPAAAAASPEQAAKSFLTSSDGGMPWQIGALFTAFWVLMAAEIAILSKPSRRLDKPKKQQNAEAA